MSDRVNRTAVVARRPIIVGVADVVEHLASGQIGREPANLLADALLAADRDAGGSLLAQLDSLDVVNVLSWPYRDLPREVARRIRSMPKRAVFSDVGGQMPVKLLHDAANRIASGDIAVAAICGAEAAKSLQNATKAMCVPSWTPAYAGQHISGMADVVEPELLRYGFTTPASIYALYENATRAAWKQSFDQAQRETAEIWSNFSRAAASAPGAWLPKVHAPEEIMSSGRHNRPIAFPFLKLMVAQDAVNLAGAIIITNEERAISLGIPKDRWIYVWGGAAAREHTDFLKRDRYDASPSMTAVLRGVLARHDVDVHELATLEIYSCFPCVPKMARRILGLDASVPLSAAGGLTFFGGPGNGYMNHGIAAVTRRLRGSGGIGLVYGQGEFLTKHHAALLANRPPPIDTYPVDYDVQAAADQLRGAIPPIAVGRIGPAVIETYTVLYDRSGKPDVGLTVLRNEAGERFIARVDRSNNATLATLAKRDDNRIEPIGLRGTARLAGDFVEWTP